MIFVLKECYQGVYTEHFTTTQLPSVQLNVYRKSTKESLMAIENSKSCYRVTCL